MVCNASVCRPFLPVKVCQLHAIFRGWLGLNGLLDGLDGRVCVAHLNPIIAEEHPQMGILGVQMQKSAEKLMDIRQMPVLQEPVNVLRHLLTILALNQGHLDEQATAIGIRRVGHRMRHDLVIVGTNLAVLTGLVPIQGLNENGRHQCGSTGGVRSIAYRNR